MENLNNCPICDSTESKLYLQSNDFSISKENFNIVQCVACNFKYTNPRPNQNSIGPYYQSEEYVSHSDTNKGVINRIYQIVRIYTLSTKLAMIDKIRRKARLLDIGAGTGAFLKFCKDGGHEITGIEPDATARKTAYDINQISLQEEKALNSFEEESFDIITMWHVLEHVHTLKERIAQVNRLLDDNGTLIIAVPNCNSFDAKHYKKHWAAYDLPRHLYHFVPSDIDKLISQFGMRIADIKPMTFDSVYVSMLSEKYKGNTGILGIIKAVLIGLLSNLKGVANSNTHSSQIYIIKKS
ncbi:MAG: class I SAM-dependent methyltransferase [Flavobacteriales bacterium]|nr:class I SAM-dependent methyltransferase [Flavobacteriales bacterium]